MPVLTPRQIYSLSLSVGWNWAQSTIATAIALAESGGKTDAVNDKNTNGTSDFGLWQINSVHGYDSKRLVSDPQYNAKAAKEVYDKQGWRAWTVWKSGAYKEHLDVLDESEKRAASRDAPVTGNIGEAAETVKEAVEDPLASVGDALGKLTEKDTWKSVGLVVLGGVLATAGVLILAGEFMKKMPTPVKGVLK